MSGFFLSGFFLSGFFFSGLGTGPLEIRSRMLVPLTATPDGLMPRKVPLGELLAMYSVYEPKPAFINTDLHTSMPEQ